jgi:VanZ family protein
VAADKGTTKWRRIFRYGPLLIWLTLIFIGSTDLLSGSHTGSFLLGPLRWLFPNASEQILEIIHLLLRKAGHLTEYAILAVLAARAFRTSSRLWLSQNWFWAAWIFAAAYSLTDEFHQSFVPTRGASIYDSLIDSLGGLIGLAIFWWWRQRTNRKKSQPPQTAKATAAA